MSSFVLYAKNMNKIFKQPQMQYAELDIIDYDVDGNYSSLLLTGEWEFFYNKWIVTDELSEATPDGLLKVPSRWSGKTFNGKKLGREGYASYRMTIKNAPADLKVVCILGYWTNAYRTYINGQLSASAGTMSDSKEIFVEPNPSYVDYYTTKAGENLEVVIELTNSNNGGLSHRPTLTTESFYKKDIISNWFGDIMFYFTLGIIVPITIIVLILNILKISDNRNYSTLLLMIAMVVRYIFSFDVFYRLVEAFPTINYKLLHIFICASSFLMYVSIINALYRHNVMVTTKYKNVLVILAINILSGIGYFLTYGNIVMYAFLCVPFWSMTYFLYQVCIAVSEKRRYAISYLILLVFVYISFTMEATELAGLWQVNISGIPSISSVIIMLTILTIYLLQVKDKIEDSRKAIALEKEINDVKNQALKHQIKPHFVFNMLTNIQDLYHKKLSDGDYALAKFSKHLRLNVDSEYKDLIDFEEELDNIQNYFDLENIRRNDALNLIFDIEYTDFQLPILSLQPLVENAVKYANTEEKKDGYIQIRSYKKDSAIIVEVNDNGKGFSISDIRENATGLKNITQRLKYSLKAEVVVNTAIGEGTMIKIIIPTEKSN